MAKRTRNSDTAGIKLRQPDRSGPTKETLIQLADEKSLFEQADIRQRQLNQQRGKAAKPSRDKKDEGGEDDEDDEDDDDDDDDDEDDEDDEISPRAERILDTLLWSISLGMLHFTLDVLVHNQYAVDIRWVKIAKRAIFSCPIFSLIFYNMHAHPSGATLLPFLPAHAQYRVRQTILFFTSVITGCYLVHITNRYSYIAVMKQAPSVGCLWIWSIIEMHLGLAMLSLCFPGAFIWHMGYAF